MSKVAKRGIFLGVLLLTISALTIYFTVDIHTLTSLKEFNISSLIFAFIALAIGMYFDGLRLQRLIRLLGYRLSITAVLKVIFGNYFMALLTPGATGGAVAQVLILRNYGVAIMEGTPVVLIRTIFSILFLCLCLPFIFIFYPISVPYITNKMLIYSSVVLMVVIVFGIAFLRTRFPKIILVKLVQVTHRGSVKSLLVKLEQLNKGFSLLYKNPIEGWIVFVESGVSLLFLYAIAPALMYAFNESVPVAEVLCRMILLNLILYFAPTPGGTGVAESLFIYLMNGFLPLGTVGIVAVAWRVLAEYVPFFVGMYAVFTLYGRGLQHKEHSIESGEL